MTNGIFSLTTRAFAYLCLLCCLINANQANSKALQIPGSRSVINNPSNHALFSCLIKHPAAVAAGRPTTMRLYLDSGGEIYPEAIFLPDDPETIRYVPKRDKSGNVARDAHGRAIVETNSECDLEWYFDRPANQSTRNEMFARYGVAKPVNPLLSNAYDSVAWDKLRTAMAVELSGRINSATEQGKKMLVVLVHGYNVGENEHAVTVDCGPINPMQSAIYYDVIQDSLIALRPQLRDAIWLEVFWDGLKDKDLNYAGPLQIWGAAQASARYAGLGLREVLSKTDTKTRVRIFTHSAGALVVSHALWNNDAFSIGRGDRYEPQLKKMMKSIETPAHKDLRVGMLVPALTSEAFVAKYYQSRTPKTNKTVYRIVVGQNHRDFPINRGPLGCSLAGATCMGGDVGALNYAKANFGGEEQEILDEDFCVTPTRGTPPKEYRELLGYEKHAWPLYFKRRPIGASNAAPPIMASFLHKLLD